LNESRHRLGELEHQLHQVNEHKRHLEGQIHEKNEQLGHKENEINSLREQCSNAQKEHESSSHALNDATTKCQALENRFLPLIDIIIRRIT
jgi:predicted  nucleic acid-binding Zn-ribbon protein